MPFKLVLWAQWLTLEEGKVWTPVIVASMPHDQWSRAIARQRCQNANDSMKKNVRKMRTGGLCKRAVLRWCEHLTAVFEIQYRVYKPPRQIGKWRRLALCHLRLLINYLHLLCPQGHWSPPFHHHHHHCPSSPCPSCTFCLCFCYPCPLLFGPDESSLCNSGREIITIIIINV